MVTIVLKSPMIYVELRFVIFVLLEKKNKIFSQCSKNPFGFYSRSKL